MYCLQLAHPVHGCPCLYIATHFHSRSCTPPLILCLTRFHMSDEQQQSSREYSFQVVTFPNPILPMPYNQPTMPTDCPVSNTIKPLFDVEHLQLVPCSRPTLHQKYPTKISSGLHRPPTQRTMIHTAWAMRHTMGRLRL